MNNFIVTTFLNLINITAIIIFYNLLFPPKSPQIVTVDVNQLITEQVQQWAKNENNSVDSKKAVESFGKKLEQSIQQLSKEQKIILLPSQAVLAGAPDFTETLKQRMSQP